MMKVLLIMMTVLVMRIGRHEDEHMNDACQHDLPALWPSCEAEAQGPGLRA